MSYFFYLKSNCTSSIKSDYNNDMVGYVYVYIWNGLENVMRVAYEYKVKFKFLNIFTNEKNWTFVISLIEV